jgi:hypothetical protein
MCRKTGFVDVWSGTFLVAATTETTDELRCVSWRRLGADRSVVVLLVAAPEVVAARIDAREPDLCRARPI